MAFTVVVMLLPPGWFGMGSISPEQLAARLTVGDATVAVVDVRTGVEYRSGHIEGAVPVSLVSLPLRISMLAPHRQREVVLICLSGHRSRIAGLMLTLAGFRHVTNLEGGMAAWRNQGLPEVR